MKSTLRVFTLLVVFVGFAAATANSRSTLVVPSHQSASAAFPVPCWPQCDKLQQK